MVAHPLLEHVRIDLRGGQIGVSEHHLYRPQVGSTLEQVCRKRMPNQMGTDRGSQTRLARVGLQNLPETDASEPGAAAARVDEQARTAPPSQQGAAAVAKIASDPGRSFVSYGDDPLLLALCPYRSGTTRRDSRRWGEDRSVRTRASRLHTAAR